MVLPGRDIPLRVFFAALWREWNADRLTDVAGSLTFFGVLAIFPFLLFLVTLGGLLIERSQVEALVQQLGQVAPPDVTEIIGGQIRAIQQGQSVGLLTVSILGALWSASGGIASLMNALNLVYDVEEGRPFWKVRGIALLATLGGGLALVLGALVAVAAGPVAEAIGGPLGALIGWLRLPLAGLWMMFAWAAIYYLLPDVEQEFRFITPGSVAGVLVWVAASWGFSLYVTRFGTYNETYGAIGGVIVLLMWMWLSSLVLLLGAEINAVIEHLSPEGKRAGARSLAERGPDLPKSVKAEERGRELRTALARAQAPPPGWLQAALGALLALLLTRGERHA